MGSVTAGTCHTFRSHLRCAITGSIMRRLSSDQPTSNPSTRPSTTTRCSRAMRCDRVMSPTTTCPRGGCVRNECEMSDGGGRESGMCACVRYLRGVSGQWREIEESGRCLLAYHRSSHFHTAPAYIFERGKRTKPKDSMTV